MTRESQSSSTMASEWQAQERALAEARRGSPASGDAHVDAYRAVFHALSRAPRSEPPGDFAERTLRAVREAEIDERIERWMVHVAGLIGVVALILFAGPTLLNALGASAALTVSTTGMLASPLIWAAAAGAVAAGLMDSWETARHRTGR
jgi:hypothetical protein